MSTLKSYCYVYEILYNYVRRIVANFLFQFFIHRYIEVTSIMVAVIANDVSATNSTIIIVVIALTQLFPALMMNEGYMKIIPYIRVIYLNKYLVPVYLLLNTTIPFVVYLMPLMMVVSESQIIQNVTLMSILLFNNTLFAHFLHVFSFSIKDVVLYLPLIVTIYLVIFIQINFLILLLLTAAAIILFISKISQNY